MKTEGCYFIRIIMYNSSYKFLRLRERLLNLAYSDKESNSNCKELLLDDGMTR